MNQCFRPSAPGRTHQSPINSGQVREHSFLSTGKCPTVALKLLLLSGKLLYLMKTDVTRQKFDISLPGTKKYDLFNQYKIGEKKMWLCVLYILKSVSFLQWSILFFIENFYSTHLCVPIKKQRARCQLPSEFLRDALICHHSVDMNVNFKRLKS